MRWLAILGYIWCGVAALCLLTALCVGTYNLWCRYQRRREISRSVAEFRNELRALGDVTGEAI